MTRESIQFACKEMWNRQVTALCSGYSLPHRALAYVQAYLLWYLKASKVLWRMSYHLN